MGLGRKSNTPDRACQCATRAECEGIGECHIPHSMTNYTTATYVQKPRNYKKWLHYNVNKRILDSITCQLNADSRTETT